MLQLTEDRSALSLEILQRLELTERENEILKWMAQGKRNGEIATILALNTSTVEKYMGHIFAKLETPSRTGALLRVIDLTEKMP